MNFCRRALGDRKARDVFRQRGVGRTRGIDGCASVSESWDCLAVSNFRPSTLTRRHCSVSRQTKKIIVT